MEWHRKNGDNVSLTANKFGVDRVRECNAKYDQLAECHGKQKKKRKIHRGKNSYRFLAMIGDDISL